MSAPLNVFIVYAPEDEQDKDDFLKFLVLLERFEKIKVWHEGLIPAGGQRYHQIGKHLASADIVIFLLSVDLFYPQEIQDVEIRIAFERYDKGEVQLYPVLLRSCPWQMHERFAGLKPWPATGEPIRETKFPDQAYTEVTKILYELVEKMQEKRDGYSTQLSPEQSLQALQQREAFLSALFLTAASFKKLFADRRKRIQPDMVLVRSGELAFGGDITNPIKTWIEDFQLGRFPVTFDEFDHFCEETGLPKPEDEGWGRGRRPVINVSSLEAVLYCNWLSKKKNLKPVYRIKSKYELQINNRSNGFRLPTYHEWLYAKRGGRRSLGFEYAGSNNLDDVGWYSKNSNIMSHPVGLKKPNELGLFDMNGNVWEYFIDWYLPPRASEGYYFGVIGGCYLQQDGFAREHSIFGGTRYYEKYQYYGFRIARSYLV